MPQDGEINLKKLKAYYLVDDVNLVDSRAMDSANEYRLTFEISSAIGFTLLGNLIGEFNWYLFVTTIIFLVFGVVSLIRYLIKQRDMLKKRTYSTTEQKE